MSRPPDLQPTAASIQSTSGWVGGVGVVVGGGSPGGLGGVVVVVVDCGSPVQPDPPPVS